MRFAQSQKGHNYPSPWLYHLPRPWPARSHKQARTHADDAVTSRPPTAHVHPPKRCRPPYPPNQINAKATRRRAMITARITDHRISARIKHRSRRRSRVAHDIHIDKPIAPHNARPARHCLLAAVYLLAVRRGITAVQSERANGRLPWAFYLGNSPFRSGAR